MKFNIGDKVKLKDDYNGYFKDFKGQVLTVKEYVKKDSSGDYPWLIINEFNESHMLYTTNFIKVKES